MRSSAVFDTGSNLSVTSFTIEGGGKMIASDLRMNVVNLTIDAGGELSLTGEGYKLADGSGTGVNDVINYGRGRGSRAGYSGGGHGGTGGRGSSTPMVGLPYGNLYEPDAFGSSGGGVVGKEGKYCFSNFLSYLTLPLSPPFLSVSPSSFNSFHIMLPRCFLLICANSFSILFFLFNAITLFILTHHRSWWWSTVP